MILWDQSGIIFIDIFKFVLSILLIIYIPGRAILGLLKSKLTPLETLACSLVVGMASSTTVYWVLALMQLSRLFLVWLAASVFALGFLIIRERILRWRLIRPVMSSPKLLLLGIYLLVIATLCMTGYFQVLKNRADGGLLISTYPSGSGWFHAAITYELAHTIPPETPLMAGVELSYHYFMDLLVSIIHQYFNLDVNGLIYRLFPLFWFGLLILSIFICVRYLTKSEWTATLCAFLIIFGSGIFNVFPGLLFVGPDRVWELAFHAPTFVSLFHVNPMLPALIVFITGIFFLAKYLESTSLSLLFLLSFLFAVLTEYKIFATFVVLGGLFSAGVLDFLRTRRTILLKATISILLLSLPFFFYHAVVNVDAAQIIPRIQLGSFVLKSLHYCRLDSLASAMKILLHDYTPTPLNILLFVFILPVYFLGGLGIRVIALPNIFKSLKFSPGYSQMKAFLGFSLVVGSALTFIFNINPVDFPQGYNNSIWFYIFSLHIGTIFAAESLVAFVSTKKELWRRIILSFIILLSLPCTVQFFYLKTTQNRLTSVSHAEMRALNFLRDGIEPGSTFLLQPTSLGKKQSRLIPGLAGHRVVLSYPLGMLKYEARLEKIEERVRDIDAFFQNPKQNIHILIRYGIDYVWINKNELNSIWDESVEYYDHSTEEGSYRWGILKEIYDNEEISIYKVHRIRDL